ncbi:MAG TPA: RIP metalloprotease RseP [Sphingobacteriaceae bacterium]|nr:RIP metalloprotease RseP [Sphingobacteriaceae bacterium]
MDGLIMAGQLILGLSILVILHELGHFLTARAFGIKVEKFYLFFDAWGVKLFSFTYKGCEYGIGWLPLGGYVKIAGMIDESMDTEQLSGPPQPWEFRSKPAWQRLIVMLGGVTVNIILGFFIFWMLTFANGETLIPNDQLTGGVSPGIVGKKIGLQAGDHILSLNGQKVKYFDEILSSKIFFSSTELTVERNGQTESIKIPSNAIELVSDYGLSEFVTPRTPMSTIDSVFGGAKQVGVQKGDKLLTVNNKPITYHDELQKELQNYKGKQVDITIARQGDTIAMKPVINSSGMMGLSASSLAVPIEQIDYSLAAALPIGVAKAWSFFTDNAKGLGKVVSGQVKANKAFAGPVGIARMFGATVHWVKFWSLVGLLSMALAFMNLLPIPALDGGHSVFLIVEMIKGKPLSDKFMERAQIVGFCILVALMVFILGNDILKAVTS